MGYEAYVHELAERYKDEFTDNDSLHSVLWKIIIHGMTAGELATFAVNQERADGPYRLVVAVASGGFIPIDVEFKTARYGVAMKIAEDLSIDVFGHSAEVTKRIRAQSFTKFCEG